MKAERAIIYDPICGKRVDEKTDLWADRDGKKLYFCTDHCRQKFLSADFESKQEDKSEDA